MQRGRETVTQSHVSRYEADRPVDEHLHKSMVRRESRRRHRDLHLRGASMQPSVHYRGAVGGWIAQRRTVRRRLVAVDIGDAEFDV